MPSARILWFALVTCGCSYEFVEGPSEAADEDDDSEADSGGTDGDEQDEDQETGAATEDSGGPELCGNGLVDPPEECDEDDFNGRDCTTLGFTSGTLACTKACKLDTTMCR